jgi:hypothetical protein
MPTITIRPSQRTIIEAIPDTATSIIDIVQASCGGHKAHPTVLRQFDPDERKIAEGVLDSLINNHQAKRLFAKQSTEHSNS